MLSREDKRIAECRGRDAERQAQHYFEALHWVVHGRRIKTPYGELDLVMITPDSTVVMVEVKARRTYEEGVHAVSLRQQYRWQRAAGCIMQHENLALLAVRFDVVVITPWQLIHLEHVTLDPLEGDAS